MSPRSPRRALVDMLGALQVEVFEKTKGCSRVTHTSSTIGGPATPPGRPAVADPRSEVPSLPLA